MQSFPENLFAWRPVFNWLTRLDAHGYAHGQALDDAIIREAPYQPHGNYSCAILSCLESKGWIRAYQYAPTAEHVSFGLAGRPVKRARKKYPEPATDRGILWRWEPSDNAEEMQKFVRDPKNFPA